MDEQNRINIRFKSDSKTLAQISFQPSKQDFEADAIGLTINESYSGSGICILTKDAPGIENEFWLKVGQLPIMRAKCVWKKEVDEDICRIGVQYLD